MDTEFDVIIVGARVAGSAAAIMLARQGRKVLLLDKASFPSDTISTHLISSGGVRVLERIGAFDELVRLGGHLYRRLRFKVAEYEHACEIRDLDGRAAPGLCMGRVSLDHAMVNFARAAGVEVVEQARVTSLIVGDGSVRGVRGSSDTQGGEFEYCAPLTIGADGMHS